MVARLIANVLPKKIMYWVLVRAHYLYTHPGDERHVTLQKIIRRCDADISGINVDAYERTDGV